MPDISTLKQDIEHVIKTGEGYTKEISEWVGDQIAKSIKRQLTPRDSVPKLRMSNLGTPCDRKLWYTVQPFAHENKEEMTPNTLNKFIFGDMIEAHTLGLVMASGHKLEGLQDYMEVDGIPGSRDCVIDGITFDVKSASTYGFVKFKEHKLEEDDPFGYLSQLSSYVYAGRNDPIVTNKTHGGFLAIEKQMGHIAVDIYDLSSYLDGKQEEVANKKDMVSQEKPPARAYSDVPDGKSGNMKLATECSYCDFKKLCWPNLQTYIYSTGPRYLTKIVREPNVFKAD